MPKPTLIEEEPMTIPEMKEEVDNIKENLEEDEELNYRAEKCSQYLNNFTRTDIETAKELKEKLEDLEISRLKQKHIIKIVDLLPTTIDDMKLLFRNDPVSISEENMEKVIEIVEETTE